MLGVGVGGERGRRSEVVPSSGVGGGAECGGSRRAACRSEAQARGGDEGVGVGRHRKLEGAGDEVGSTCYSYYYYCYYLTLTLAPGGSGLGLSPEQLCCHREIFPTV